MWSADKHLHSEKKSLEQIKQDLQEIFKPDAYPKINWAEIESRVNAENKNLQLKDYQLAQTLYSLNHSAPSQNDSSKYNLKGSAIAQKELSRGIHKKI